MLELLINYDIETLLEIFEKYSKIFESFYISENDV